MIPTRAPAAVLLRKEWTAKCPDRSQVSDGILSSDAHRLQNPVSDHDHGNAVDITHSPTGVDVHAWVRELVKRGDPRVRYVISDDEIWSVAYRDEGWRPYNGANRHQQHAHISIYSSCRDDVSTWFPAPKIEAPTAPISEDDAMSPEQFAQWKAANDGLRRDVRELANFLNKIAATVGMVGPESRLEVLKPTTLDGKIES